jgi:hypothetical protein
MSSPSPGQPWSEPQPNPYAAADAAKPEMKPSGSGQRIAFLPALRFVTEHPEWLKNVLLLGLFLLIPVIGTLSQLGYAYEITELKHRRPGSSYSPFDFNRFAAYVTRGVWPFIIFFVAQTIVSVAYQIVFQGTMWSTIAAMEANEETGAIIAAVLIPTAVISFLTFVLAVMILSRPLMLRAGLSQDFAQTCKFPWFGDFLKRMWLETTLVCVFTLMLSLILVPLGLALCCIGVVFPTAFLAIAGAHLDYQLYELYLARGGEPIPLKPLPGEVPPVVYPTSPSSSASP